MFKKAKLLLGAAILFCSLTASADEIEYTYIPGEGLKDPAELVDGGLYFLHIKFAGDRTKDGFMIGLAQNTQFARFSGSYLKEIPEAGLNANASNNANYIWRLIGTAEGFKVQCLGANGRCLSREGGGGISKNDVKAVTSPDDTNAAIYKLEVPSGCADLTDEGRGKRFWFRITNGSWNGNANAQPCLMCNGSNTTDERVAYWNYDTNQRGYLQFELIPAIAVENTVFTTTIKFPQINGTDVADKTLEIRGGLDATTAIRALIDEMGGMANATITGQNGTTTVGADNRVFTVSGTWDREFIANHVYRLCLHPNDRAAAMRYDAISGNVKITSDYNDNTLSTFNRLVPERLWYFRPVEGKPGVYTLHTLADTEKGIYIEDSHDANEHIAYATLSDTPTEFTAHASTWNRNVNNDNFIGDLCFSYGNNGRNYLNDRGQLLANWTNTSGPIGDAGSAFRLYPITADDLATLSVAAGTEPTAENLAQAVMAFNATNVAAALRRVRYIGADLIGPYVGQYDNPEGNARELYEKALTLPDDASDDEKAEIVNALDESRLTFTELHANRFYRFKSKVSGLYMSSISSTTSSGGRAFMDLTDDGTRSNTVFYLHEEGTDTTLVCFDNGLVLPSFTGSNWIPVVKGDEDAAQGTKLAYQNNGRYLIHVSGTGDNHRHLHGAANSGIGDGRIVACGNNTNTDEYQWYVEPVKELPLTLYNVVGMDDDLDDNGWTSVYSPVALEIPANSGLTAYTGRFDSNAKLVKPAKAGNIIPANQTTLLYFDGEGDYESSLMDDRQNISYVYLPLIYDAETEAAPAQGLNGGIFAMAMEANKKYYTLHESHFNNFRQYTSDNYVPGFKAYLASEASDNTEAYPIALEPEELTPEIISDTHVFRNADGSDYAFTIRIDIEHEGSELYFVHTAPTAEKAARRAADHSGYTKADIEEGTNTHTFQTNPGVITYYVYHPQTETKGSIRSITLDGDGNTTGIGEITSSDSVSATYFDLQGRRLAAPVKGIYLRNGQKVFVR